MKKQILYQILALFVPVLLFAASIELSWTSNTDPVDSYKVYQTQTENIWSLSTATILAPATIYNSPTLPGGTYWFAVTALKDGAESAKSVSVRAVVPPNVPVGLSVKIKN